jgi:prophage tail gpP-like protein
VAWSGETAILTVNGADYADWESVSVKHELQRAPFNTCRFTCSEGMPLAKNWTALQIKPGDSCSITLGGEPAFNGLIYSRQVFYDSKRHYIELQGASQVMKLAYSSVAHQTMEFNKVTMQQYASALTRPYGIGFTVEGGALPQTEFPRLSNAPGTSVLEAIEIPLRALGGIQLASNLQQDLVAWIGNSGGGDTVTEGVDILEGREVIYDPGIVKGINTLGQQPGGDQTNMSKSAHEPFNQLMQGALSGFGYLPASIPMEIPAWSKSMLSGRGSFDSVFQSSNWITLHITVQGWFKPSGGLWQRGQVVNVYSPMLMMYGTGKLTAKSVTFLQDNQGGTRTILELCNDNALGGGVPAGPGAS